MAELDRWIEGLDRPDVADALARQREHRKGTWVARGLMAVSYTHLTLPTNREV